MGTAKPGIVVLLGSGETLPSSGQVHEYVARRLPERPRIVILETPAGFEPNSKAVAGKIREFLVRRLQNYEPAIEVLPARRRGTSFSPDNPEIVSPILEADEILMGPGSPTYAARQLRNSLALEMIAARQRLGAALFLSSAATLAFGTYTLPVYEIYKVGEDLHWKAGLNYFHQYGLSFSIVPHWNNRDGGEELDTSRCYVGDDRFLRLRAMLPSDHPLLGIDEHTALVVDVADGCCHVLGNDSVTLLDNDRSKVFESGASFALDEIGTWQMPQAHADIEESVWEKAVQVQAARESRDAPKPSAEVISLVQAREDARSDEDWPTADALRDQIASLGWQVRDTPEGTELLPESPS